MIQIHPRWKVLYLLAVTVGAFWTGSPAVLIGLVILQTVIWFGAGLPWNELFAAVWRLKFFFILFVLLNIFSFSGEGSSSWGFSVFSHPVSFDIAGLSRSVLMCIRVTVVVFTSMVIRRTGQGDFVRGMRSLRVPDFLASALDGTLMFLAAEAPGQGKGGGQGRGLGKGGRQRGKDRGSFISLIRNLLRGDVTFLTSLTDRIGKTIERAKGYSMSQGGQGRSESYHHDLGVVTGMAVVMMSLKFLKVMPGMPVAPGWKNLLFIPLLILSSELTNNGWGGTLAGSTMGIVAFLFGDGKYGIFEVFQHVTPGLLIDLFWPLFRRMPRSIIAYGILGFLASAGKFATILLVLFFMESGAMVYTVILPFGIPHLVFGALSGIITFYLIGSADSIRKTAGLHG